MIYDYEGSVLPLYPTIIGDGVTDDTEALQSIVDTYASVRLPSNLTIKISDTIDIDPDKCKLFDGGNSTILISGDITAFKITGSVQEGMRSNPYSLTSKIMNSEGGFTFCNCKIQGTESGTAIKIDSCFKVNVCGCYIHHVQNGIVIINTCRDLEILGNHIYACQQDGICIDESANVHQCNINDNIINYAYYCIHFDKPRYTANFQICGNDIEISQYPGATNQANYRCILIDSRAGETETTNNISETEITGNTIQGHSNCASVIEMLADASPTREIRDLSVVGNHISNCADNLIVITNVFNAVFDGNTLDGATDYAFSLSENCNVVSICNNACVGSGGLVENTGNTSRLSVCANTSSTNKSNPVNLVGAALSYAIINGNCIGGNNTGMVVNPTSLYHTVVTSNVTVSGTYTLHASVTAANNV